MTYSLIGYGIQGILPVGYEVVILGEGFSSPHSYIEGRARFNGFYNTFFTFFVCNLLVLFFFFAFYVLFYAIRIIYFLCHRVSAQRAL